MKFQYIARRSARKNSGMAIPCACPQQRHHSMGTLAEACERLRKVNATAVNTAQPPTPPLINENPLPTHLEKIKGEATRISPTSNTFRPLLKRHENMLFEFDAVSICFYWKCFWKQMKMKPCGPCTVRCDRHLSEAFLHLTLESSNWWKPRRFFVVSHMFQNDFRWKNHHFFVTQLAPASMPHKWSSVQLPCHSCPSETISVLTRFASWHAAENTPWCQGTFPSFWCGNYRVYLKEESESVHFEGLWSFWARFWTKSSKPNEFRVPSSPTFSPGALTRLKNKMDMDDMKMPTDVGNQWPTIPLSWESMGTPQCYPGNEALVSGC